MSDTNKTHVLFWAASRTQVHSTVPNSTLPSCGAVLPWHQDEHGLRAFLEGNAPPPWSFVVPANLSPKEADIYCMWCVATATRPAFNAPKYVVGRVVEGMAMPKVQLPRQKIARVRRALQASLVRAARRRRRLWRG